MYQVWLRYLSRFFCSAPETKRDGRTEGRKDGRTEGRTSAPIPISPCHFVAGDNNVNAKFYFTRRILHTIFQQIQPLPPQVAPPFHGGQYTYLRALAPSKTKSATPLTFLKSMK